MLNVLVPLSLFQTGNLLFGPLVVFAAQVIDVNNEPGVPVCDQIMNFLLVDALIILKSDVWHEITTYKYRRLLRECPEIIARAPKP